MTHWRSLLPNEYLGVWDLAGKDWTLQIESVSRSKAGQRKDEPMRRVEIRFRGARKPWLAGPASLQVIQSLHGVNVESWVGKSVTLYPAETRAPNPVRGGPQVVVPCIRPRPTMPKASAVKEMPMQEVDEEARAKQDAAFGGEEAAGG